MRLPEVVQARRAIRRDGRASAIALATSQLTTGFYESLGFRTARVSPNGFAEGLDRHEMLLRLDAPFLDGGGIA